MKLINKLIMCAISVVSLGWTTSCNRSLPTTVNIQLLATSDIHGMLIPFDYALNEDVTSRGSLSQIGTIINQYRNENTITIDAGDIMQGNYADIFKKYDTHPMIEALNLLKYDVFVTGNHEYNFGMDYLTKQLTKFNGTVLTGNVFNKKTSEPLALPFTVFKKGPVKVAVIGMTTHLIKTWDEKNLKDWNVYNAIKQTKIMVNFIKRLNLADVIVAAEHLGMPEEYGEEGTSCRELAKQCPDIDVIIASHEHKEYIETVNNVLIVENKSNAQTLMKVDLEVSRKNNRYKVEHKQAKSIKVGSYSTNKTIDNFAKPYDKEAREDAGTEIGNLINGPMSPEYEIKKVPSTFMKPTALTTFINQVQLAAAKEGCPEVKDDIKVASTAVGNYKANIDTGKIHKYDCSKIYKYENTLYVVNMTGKQLKKYLEWTAQFYQKYESNDLTIAFKDNTDFALFNYDMFTGINYDINIAKEEGKRIENLKWSDGKSVKETDTFKATFNNYRCNTHLLKPGLIYEAGECPTLYKADVKQGKGIREMIVEYVQNLQGNLDAKDAILTNQNWKITGPLWLTDQTEKSYHDDAVKKINAEAPGYDIGEFNTIKIKKS